MKKLLLFLALALPSAAFGQFLPVPYVPNQYFDDNGNPLSNGKIFSWVCGSTLDKLTFQNYTGTANSNPITLSASGRPVSGSSPVGIYLTPASCYRIKVVNSAGATIRDQDGIIVYAGGGGGGGSGTVSLITGTPNQITVINGSGPTVSLTLPQDICPGCTPTFASEFLSSTQNNKVVYVDGTGRLISSSTFGFDGTTVTTPALTAQTPTGDTSMKLGAMTGDTDYNMFSFNGSLSPTAGIGWYAGKTGDSGMYGTLPTGGEFRFAFNNVSGTFIDVNGLRSKIPVVANTAGSGAPHVLTAADSGTLITNEGATAESYQALPTAAPNLHYFACVQDADGIRFVANSGDTIRMATLVTSAAGYIESTTIGSCVHVIAINATEWFSETISGTWSVSS